jgi:hypothetical protein
VVIRRCYHIHRTMMSQKMVERYSTAEVWLCDFSAKCCNIHCAQPNKIANKSWIIPCIHERSSINYRHLLKRVYSLLKTNTSFLQPQIQRTGKLIIYFRWRCVIDKWRTVIFYKMFRNREATNKLRALAMLGFSKATDAS